MVDGHMHMVEDMSAAEDMEDTVEMGFATDVVT
jgi:hypothetical protein